MSEIFPSLPEPLEMKSLFQAFPKTIKPLLDYHDRLLRDWSPLTVGERELIAAYVSGLNACTYCHGAHTLAAQAFGIDEAVFETLMMDPDVAPLNDKLKPVLAYVRKLTLTPTRMTADDAQAVYAAGWDEQALFDAISVCALFNFMNRIVEGSGLRSNPLVAPEENRKAHMLRLSGGVAQEDSHEAAPAYTRLLSLWEIA
jgi:uncharacterized peroxidase-related enzyme